MRNMSKKPDLLKARKSKNAINEETYEKLRLKLRILYGPSNLHRPLNTLTANYEYSRSNTDNLLLPLQMQLSEKLKTFSAFFYCIFRICIKF